MQRVFSEPDAELSSLLLADQRERQQGLGPESARRDEERRRRVHELLEEGAVVTGDDYFAAAMILQHGSTREHHWQAHELALRAVELGHEGARWLAAAAYDRWLTDAGLPQRYGTQYRSEGDRWVFLPVEPTMTDEERARWNVPPLAEAQRRAEDMTRRSPPVAALSHVLPGECRLPGDLECPFVLQPALRRYAA